MAPTADKRPQSNGLGNPSSRTGSDAYFAAVGRPKWTESADEMQKDLVPCLQRYIRLRSPQDLNIRGQTQNKAIREGTLFGRYPLDCQIAANGRNTICGYVRDDQVR